MTRLSVNINDETATTLRRLAEKHQTSVTDIVRRAVAVYHLVWDETENKGYEMQLVDEKRNTVKTIELLP